MVDIASQRYQQGLRRGLKQREAWQQSTCDWVAAAKVRGHLDVVESIRLR